LQRVQCRWPSPVLKPEPQGSDPEREEVEAEAKYRELKPLERVREQGRGK